MAILSKDQILGAADLKTQVVPVPEWKGEVVVSEMTAAARMEWEMDAFDDAGKPVMANWKAKLVARCVVDEKGELLFTVDEIGRKSAPAVNRLYAVAVEINGLGPKAVEEEAKN